MKKIVILVVLGMGLTLLFRKFAGNLPGLGGGPIGPSPVGPVGKPPRPIDPDDR